MRRSIVITAAAALTLGLAACGDSGEETPEPADPTTDAAEDETATEPAGDADAGALTIWVDDTREAAVRAAAESFETETGTTVELVQKNYDDIRPDFLAQVPTGEGPDITVGAHDWLGELTANGVVAPVELGDKASEFEEVAVEAFTYEGQVYALPYAIENIAIFRNAELVDETPATFDEMIAAGEESGAQYPFLIQITENGDPYTMYPFQTSFGAPVFETNEDGSYSAELALGGEAGNAFATWLAEQGEAGNLNTSWEYDIVVEAFANGEAAYLLGGPWMLSSFEGIDVAVDPIPTAGGEPAQPFTGVQGFYVSAQSDNALLATDFLINYMATEEAQIALYEAGDRTPALTAAADTVAEDPIAAGFREVGAEAVPMPSIPEMGEVWNFWGVTEAQIITGSTDPVEGWEKMVADIEAAIGG